MSNLQDEKNRIEEEIARLYRQREEIRYKIARGSADNKPSNLKELLEKTIRETPEMFPSHATVACQGIEGAYSQIAAERLLTGAL